MEHAFENARVSVFDSSYNRLFCKPKRGVAELSSADAGMAKRAMTMADNTEPKDRFTATP
jgi:hypothetical protein